MEKKKGNNIGTGELTVSVTASYLTTVTTHDSQLKICGLINYVTEYGVYKQKSK